MSSHAGAAFCGMHLHIKRSPGVSIAFVRLVVRSYVGQNGFFHITHTPRYLIAFVFLLQALAQCFEAFLSSAVLAQNTRKSGKDDPVLSPAGIRNGWNASMCSHWCPRNVPGDLNWLQMFTYLRAPPFFSVFSTPVSEKIMRILMVIKVWKIVQAVQGFSD